jgi:hypothetical protein
LVRNFAFAERGRIEATDSKPAARLPIRVPKSANDTALTRMKRRRT